MDNTLDTLEKLGIEYWLDSGTLLSVMRENGVSSWHRHVDIAIDGKNLPILLEAKKHLPLTYRLKPIKNLSVRQWIPTDSSRVKILHVWEKSKNSPECINITIKHRTDNEYRWIDHRSCKSVPVSLLEKLDTVTIDGRKYPIPAASEEYLTARYGNWKKPKRYWFSTIDDLSIASQERLEQIPFNEKEPKVSRDKKLLGTALLNIKALLLRIIDIFDEKGIRYWVDDGTLLGIIRDGDLIPWDNDIDLGIAGECAPVVLNLRHRFLPRYMLMRQTGYTGWLPADCEQIKVGIPWRQARKNLRKILPGLSQKPLPWGDLIAKYRVGDHYHWIDCGMLKKISADFYEKLDTIKWEGRTIYIPSNVEKYLHIRYGNWREPDPGFNPGISDGTIAEKGI